MRQLGHPSAGVEIGMRIDEAGHYPVGAAQVRAGALQPSRVAASVRAHRRYRPIPR